MVGGGLSTCRVTVRDFDITAPLLSLAVTVKPFAPTLRGTEGTVQLEAPLAIPENPWSLVQRTSMVPDPPVAVPDIEIEACVVVSPWIVGLMILRESGGTTCSGKSEG